MGALAPIAIILCAMLSPILVSVRGDPLIPYVQYATDLTIAVASLFIVARLIATRSWVSVPIKYVLVFVGFCYVVMVGIVVNEVSSDTAFSGMRAYLKYVPLFLAPFAFSFSDNAIRGQLTVLALVMGIQIPVAIYQRFVQYAGMTTGDHVAGTLTSTSSQCMIAVFAILFAAALYLDKRIRASTAIVLSLAFLIPAALSETKVTPIILSLGGAGVLYARRRELGTRLVAQIGVAGGAMLVLFVLFFNLLYAEGRGRTYIQEMTDTAAILDRYNMTGVRARSFRVAREPEFEIVGARREHREPEDRQLVVGRFDTLRMPFNVLLPHEKIRLLVGLGVGNVDSSFGSGGDYMTIKRELDGTSTALAALLWETGVLGALLFVTFLLFLARDALKLSVQEDLMATLAVGAFASLLVYMLCLIYANMFHHDELPVLLCYVGGLVVARLARMRAVDAFRSPANAEMHAAAPRP